MHLPASLPRSRTASSIHKEILRKKEAALVKDILAKAPEIQQEKVLLDFINSVNHMQWKERLKIIWRLLCRKL